MKLLKIYLYFKNKVFGLDLQDLHYMKKYKDAELYGNGSIALYSGSNALTQLATSPDATDRALYDELCEFIIGNRTVSTNIKVVGNDEVLLRAR